MPCLRNSLTAEGGLERALGISVMELEACERMFSKSYSSLKRSSETAAASRFHQLVK